MEYKMKTNPVRTLYPYAVSVCVCVCNVCSRVRGCIHRFSTSLGRLWLMPSKFENK